MKNSNRKPINTVNLFKSIWSHFQKKRKIQIILLLFLMASSAIAELLSLAALIPFLAIVSEPERLWRLNIIKLFANIFKIDNSINLLFYFALIFGVLSIISTVIKLSNIWLNKKIVASLASDLSIKALKNTLNQPYETHIQTNSSKIISGLSSHLDNTQYLMNFGLQLVTSLFVSIGILGGIFLANWKTAILAGFFIGGSYLFIVIKTKKILIRNSKFITNSINTQTKNLQEALGAIRDIILHDHQKTFIKIYASNDHPRRSLQASNQYFQQFPKSILESLTILFGTFFCVIFISKSADKTEIITTLGTLTLGAQKLLPACQQIYSSWVGIKSNVSSAEVLLGLLEQNTRIVKKTSKKTHLDFKKSIELKNLNFSYDNERLILHSINLRIKKGEIIGIIGKTGSGKSTLVDLIIGLLKPNNGKIEIDGRDIYFENSENKIVSWRKNISHIPQSIFLRDATIYENIAFGIEKQKINKSKVRKVAELACIKSFIENELGSYNKYVGEKGIKLSGGQLQRIGIARALYKESSLLVMDEATSSLDSDTENKIINSIINLKNKPTIIMIAHKYNTLLNCNRIIQIEDGRIVKQGSPRDIINSLPKEFNLY
tara:strand:- start:499 stop:2313 length:1815 start_codon:yes stop_codon:yes gene_type:complete